MRRPKIARPKCQVREVNQVEMKGQSQLEDSGEALVALQTSGTR